MKKFAKVMSITALVLAVLGLMLTIIGAFGGGAKLVKNLAENGGLSIGPEDFELVKWIDEFSIVVTDDSTVVFNDNYEIFTAGSHEFSATAEEVDSFVLSLTGGDVDIEQDFGENWEVQVDGFGRFQTYVEDGTLYVVANQNGVSADFGDVTIVIPQTEQLQNAEINLGAGDMDIFFLNAEEMKISVGAGDITVESAYSQNLEVSVGAGEVEVVYGRLGDVEVSVGMGAAYITGSISGNFDGAVSMGELCVEVLDSDEKDHNYNISCAAGEVRVGGKTYAGVGNSMEIDNDADTTYNLDCAMGRIEVSFE